MKIFIDTEFNGYRGALISIALVAEKPDCWFYRVLPLPDGPTAWVANFVIPHLNQVESDSIEQVRAEMVEWLTQFDDVHIVADWIADIEHFLRLLDTGPGLRVGPERFTMEVWDSLSSKTATTPHNALSDALAIRDSWIQLNERN